MKIRKATTLILSWILVFIICIFLMEAFFLGAFYKRLPPNIPVYFDRRAHIFSQYSKQGTIPEHYIAIFGDSYAEGAGDWYLNNQLERMPDSQVTHLLHKSTGRDVVTFGLSATGSSNYITLPVTSLQFIKSMWFYDITDPDIIFLYFYEGNDVIDNNADYRNIYLKKGYDPARLADIDYFEQFFLREYLENDETYQNAETGSIANNFLFTQMAYKLLHQIITSFMDGNRLEKITLTPATVSENTRVIADGREIPVPDTLDTAPLDRTPEEYRTAMLFFENCVKLVKKYFPDARINIVYIPSPGTTYRFAPGTLKTVTEKPDNIFPTTRLAEASNILCRKIQDIAQRNAINFHDTRPALRAAAEKRIIHGPSDWFHFSEAGYRVLSNEIEQFYQQIAASPGNPVYNTCSELP